MDNLKIIDELLCLFKPKELSWGEFENEYNITKTAISTLRNSWNNGQMDKITLSLSKYFKGEIKCKN